MSFTDNLDQHPKAMDAAGRKGPVSYECYRRAARRERLAARDAAFEALGRWMSSLFAAARRRTPLTGRV